MTAPESLREPEAAQAAPAAAASSDPLIALEAEHRVAYAALSKAIVACGDGEEAWFKTPRPEHGTPEYERAYAETGLAALKEEVDAAQEHAFSFVRKIITTPAVSVEGVAVKLRQAIYWIKIGTEGPEQELVRSALEDVERLADPGWP